MNAIENYLAQPISLLLINGLPGMMYRRTASNPSVITFVSSGCLPLTGYTEKEILGNSKLSYLEIIHPDDRSIIWQYQLKQEELLDFSEVYRIVCANGRIKWVREIARGIYGKNNELLYIEGYITDIDYEKKENLALNSLTAYQKAVDTSAIVSIADIRGVIVYANDLFCRISQYSRNELIGKNHRVVNSGFHQAVFFEELWLTILSGKVWHGEIKNRARDGSYYWVDTTISPIFNNNGRVSQYLSIRSLITERKNLELDREKLNSELTHKYNELMQFNYIVSHNLRAPIANMISLSRLLSEEGGNYDPNSRTLIQYLSRSVLTLDEVIKDLTQILSARSPLHEKIEDINLLDIVNSVEDTLENQIIDSGTKLFIDIKENARHFKSIHSYVQSILYNLISNAIKYAKEDICPSISIKAEKTGNEVVIIVADNGIGLDMDKIGKQLFGLYKKFNFNKEGRGLGLHMTKTQVESLGGTIEVVSQEGQGATFTISLPV